MGCDDMLPIDIRLIPDIFSFSHVKGIARVFLMMEVILSTLVVVGTVILVILKIFIN
ncbi:MAG: hypothetical protein UW22_C0009G0024 [Candidatus Gottesmanbacteria bacterium GW2011_GWB1_44_11c]|uniref:Uncharacterized protein n=2 Tax=Candidatus Gottesmaniibacteriota TaxID=1752720 RepID=A0A0G1LLV5_9BACT|nr:MAG: hypothetical protein UW22_C0009G0024 [Candidatus Gottesmanbacteria bacterium GW2011_GWB1_44_11c]KKT60809.1 MAG: hypothetical protein UW52_C0017G0020 [Candidatus Gottesmanbacteria bacterium GW2011_GWA1_44_24b]